MAIEWLQSALMDLRSIEKVQDDEFLTPIACFHAQQCVEKSLKAVLENNECQVPKSHDVVKLYALIQQRHAFSLDFEMLQRVGELYIDARYPGEFGLLPEGKPTLGEVVEFYRFAKGVYDAVVLLVGA
jgi:HEPN domain-containing protein